MPPKVPTLKHKSSLRRHAIAPFDDDCRSICAWQPKAIHRQKLTHISEVAWGETHQLRCKHSISALRSSGQSVGSAQIDTQPWKGKVLMYYLQSARSDVHVCVNTPIIYKQQFRKYGTTCFGYPRCSRQVRHPPAAFAKNQ